MATFTKRGSYWRAEIRNRGWPTQSRSFDSKIQAEVWARALEGDIGAHAQGVSFAVADSNGGRQIAGVGIDHAAIYNGINDARGRAQNAQGTAEWGRPDCPMR